MNTEHFYTTGCIKKSRQFRNGSQPREAASSIKFFVNIDCIFGHIKNDLRTKFECLKVILSW